MKTHPLHPLRACVATALIIVFTGALAAYANIAEPASEGAVTPAPGRVVLSPAIQLPINATPPIACAPATAGTLALDSKAHLCVCDGNAWKLANLDTPCDWKAAP